MPVHIGELNAKVTVVDGDLPLTPRQVENLDGRFDEGHSWIPESGITVVRNC